jgi:methylated-DNA-protein-cysteine methyltransferase-like protein
MASSEITAHVAKLYESMYAVIRRIPAGRVATYGQIAELAGLPGGARVAAAALKTCKPGYRVPWQRVIGKAGPNRGRIAIHDPVGAAVQRQLLDDEGVRLNDTGLIALDRFGWLPGDAPTQRRAANPSGKPRKSAKARKASAAAAIVLASRQRTRSKRRATKR